MNNPHIISGVFVTTISSLVLSLSTAISPTVVAKIQIIQNDSSISET
ncbi:hypothetical protein H7169_03060 [Candidatus Gracilibacteria bacterium]|nr:hypothetical protein [Candidatus Gracilibacteria bacterium]